VRLRQEVQEVPRRLIAPEPPLSDDAILLEPLGRRHVEEFGWAVDGDPDIIRFTRVPTNPDADFLAGWLGGYEDAWRDGTKAGFAIRAQDDGTLLGFAGIVALDMAGQEGEIGYALRREGRGRGAATRAVSLLTRWALEDLGLRRAELLIDVENTASERVAERCGYRLDGVLRSVHVKEGRRADLGVWSRLHSD
jgi:RimJ/RimL family protein N-acetyltransferase